MMDTGVLQILDISEIHTVEDTIRAVNEVLDFLLDSVEGLLLNLGEIESLNSLKSAEELKKGSETISEKNEILEESIPSESEFVDAVENDENLLSDSSNNLSLSERRLIPVDGSLRTLNLSTDASCSEDDDDRVSLISTVTLDSDTDSEDDEFIIAPNSEEIGDQDNLDELNDFNFLERMIRFFRNADAVLNTNRGSGDHPGIDSDDDEEDFLGDNNDNGNADNINDDFDDDFDADSNDDNNDQNNAVFNDDNDNESVVDVVNHLDDNDNPED